MRKLRDLSERLDRTVIEQLSYEVCIEHYDKRDTFFFLDPPYVDATPGIYAGWTEEQMRAFAAVVDHIKGPWIITVNDSPATREIFGRHRFSPTVMCNKLAAIGKNQVMMRELIITPAKSRQRRDSS